jgi:hypothetical protein
LKPIVLTEAFGCDRCQKIFVLQENGYVLEQLSTTYPYKRAWQWTGHQWNLAHSTLSRSYIPLTLAIMLAFIVALLLLRALQLSLSSGTFWQAILVVALIFLLVMLWLACRR